MTTTAILTHGGAASAAEHSDGCRAAAERAAEVLRRGGDALAAALAATVALEDDVRFNAGTGSNLRFDGRLVQMDASVMASDGRFGAVACIERVKNPILVAARVMETPHLMLVGEGATAFARRVGFALFDPVTPRAVAKWDRAMAELQGYGDGTLAEDAEPWRALELERYWNFPSPVMRVAPKGMRIGEDGEAVPVDPGAPPNERKSAAAGTVGAVVRDASGRFCATASTGGTLYMLRGRVGDSPLMGCGVYAGEHGAVAATGVGEHIVRRLLAKTVHDWLAAGVPARAAAERGVALFPTEIDVGLLVAGRDGEAVAANRSMASALVVA
ncbi:MAG: isoaspartyl peptidase/L-asparaginase [Myxococcales bacterium]|nr:isoaspartyl peptidase/L-asparaginase [Myxococcales bacterium]